MKIELTKHEADVLVVLIDAGIKTLGARVIIEGGEVMKKLRDAAQSQPDDDEKEAD